MERITLLHTEAVLAAGALERLCLPPPLPAVQARGLPAHEDDDPLDESARIRQALVRTGGNVVRAAQLLGLSRNILRYRMRRYGIARPPWEELSLSHAAGEQRPTPRSVSRSGSLPSVAPRTQLPRWEQKSVVVLAVALTFPSIHEPGMLSYAPWTAATRWEQVLTEKVHGFGGVLLQYSPALLLAAFGIPRTLDQMPQRAVQTALAIRRLVAEAHTALRTEPYPVAQFAVHQGTVLVDTQAPEPAQQLLAVGDTLTHPVRLLGHARDGELLVSSQVGPQVKDVCTLEERELPWEGESTHRHVYTVRGLRSWQTPLAGRVLRQFVGRERELAALHAYRAQAESGRG